MVSIDLGAKYLIVFVTKLVTIKYGIGLGAGCRNVTLHSTVVSAAVLNDRVELKIIMIIMIIRTLSCLIQTLKQRDDLDQRRGPLIHHSRHPS